MASITIGGKEYLIPEMNFLAIERSWPYVEKATSTIHPMEGVSAALGVFAAGIMEAEGFNKADFGIDEDTTAEPDIHKEIMYFLKKGLKGTEMDKVRVTMFEVLKEAGLEVTEGEATAVLTAALENETEEPNLFPETAPDTSQNSLPLDAKEDPGTS